MRIFFTTPPAGAVIGFITFIASTISNVSPALTASPTATNGLASGCGDRKAVPTIGDLTVSPDICSGVVSAVADWAAAAATGGAGTAAAGAAARSGAGSRRTFTRRSPSSTSISVNSFSVSSSASSRTSAGSIRIARSFSPLADSAIARSLLNLALGLARGRSLAEVRRRVQCEHIAKRAEAGDRTPRDLGNHALPAKALAREDVRQVHFDYGDWQRRDRIANGDRRVAVAAGAEDHRRSFGHGLVQPVDQHALMVRLADVELELQALGALL